LTVEARVEPQAKSGGAHSASTGPIKRSVTIAGHETSISLEPLFWEGLSEAARALGLPLNALIARIDAQRIEASKPPNLASAIRVWLYARARGDESGAN
jgi:predicted DNA-binding ribbon-helix-helix protein